MPVPFEWIGIQRCLHHWGDLPPVAAKQCVDTAKRSARTIPALRVGTSFSSGAGQAVETVFIPETERGTLCISSQVGCALDCAFCATGAQGFNRNLTSAEIIGQVRHAIRELPRRDNGEPAVTNVVFMGMGEPLANYRNVVPVLQAPNA